MKKGLFITFEGGEGAGKSTQCKRLKMFLEGLGHDVILTREPGGTPEAEKIRDLLAQRDGGNWTPMAECLLFFAARQMHVETLIKPALAVGKIVISDRFTDSTIAYQGFGHGFDITTIRQIEKITLNGFAPDITLLLDLPVDAGLARSLKQKNSATGRENTEDRFEKLGTGFHEKVRHGFLTIARENPSRMHVVNATRDVDSVFQSIKEQVRMLFDGPPDDDVFFDDDDDDASTSAAEIALAEIPSPRATEHLIGHEAIEKTIARNV